MIRRGKNPNSAPLMHRKQMARIATDYDISPAGEAKFQIFVVLWVAAFPDSLSGLDPFVGFDLSREDKAAGFSDSPEVARALATSGSTGMVT